MIVKVKIGKSFGGCVRYNLDKDKAEVLKAEGVRMDNSKHMTTDFNQVRKLNKDLGKAVWHTSISFAPEDKVSNKLMEDIAKDYVDKFKLEQYAVIRHNDGNREHFHIIGNRVKFDGSTVPDKYCAGRGVELSHRLEKKYELTQSKEVGKRLEHTHIENLRGDTKIKYEILNSVNKEKSKCKTLEELQQKLKSHEINMDIKKHESGNVSGVSFSKGSASFKGSQIDKNLGAQKLIQSLPQFVPGLNQATKIVQATKIIKPKTRNNDMGGPSMSGL